jgi:myo-inositol-1(or 4)-monophosphatase
LSIIAGLRRERDVAVQAAKAAGRVLLDWQGRFSVSKKGVNDVVTEADHAAQEAIRQMLERHFPQDGFVGEEAGADLRLDAARRWVVDPLDGTTNYVHGFPFFCTSIALEAGGKPVVGVIFDPVRQECFAAAEGLGAECNGAPLRTSKTVDLHDALLFGGLPADMRTNRKPLEVFLALGAKGYSVRRLGSAALALAYVAAGRAEAFFAHKVEAWDVAAGAALVQEAGGQTTHVDGSPYRTSRGDILADNGLLHAEMLAELR